MIATDETRVRLQVHTNNARRYRQLLQTSLSDRERAYVEKRLSEEHASIDALSASSLLLVKKR